MPRLTVFAKGNSDISESLFSCRDGHGTWNGLGEAMRGGWPDWRVRVKHEVFARSDVLLAAQGEVPTAFANVEFDAPFDLQSQSSTALFEGDYDAVVLSIQPDVSVRPLKHRASGHLLIPYRRTPGSADLASWIRSECEPMPLLTAEQFLRNFTIIVERIRRRTAVPILIYNLSSIVPGENIDMYTGLGETLPTRIKRFNLALIELSERTGIIVVDVDRVAARHGADALKLDGTRLNCRGCRLVAGEVLRLLEEHDCFVPR